MTLLRVPALIDWRALGVDPTLVGPVLVIVLGLAFLGVLVYVSQRL